MPTRELTTYKGSNVHQSYSLHQYNRNCSWYSPIINLMLIQMFTSGKVVWNVQLASKKIWSGSENRELKFQSRVLLDQHMQLIYLNWLGAVPLLSFPTTTIFIFPIQLEGWQLVIRYYTFHTWSNIHDLVFQLSWNIIHHKTTRLSSILLKKQIWMLQVEFIVVVGYSILLLCQSNFLYSVANLADSTTEHISFFH